ncbi:hypothetical protein IV498_13025 [Paenarthrobacter sp. Z7-10]|nr:hypothetical protein [Paenarthrobacter sp. Z7-10]
MGLVSTDPALGYLDPFLDLGQVRVRDPTPEHRFSDGLPSIAGCYVAGHRVV